MSDLGWCKFCLKPIKVEQEAPESFIVSCDGGCDFYLTKGMSGATPEVAIEKYQVFIKELDLGAEMWGSKIRDGVAED